jgi:hypothetical protein
LIQNDGGERLTRAGFGTEAPGDSLLPVCGLAIRVFGVGIGHHVGEVGALGFEFLGGWAACSRAARVKSDFIPAFSSPDCAAAASWSSRGPWPAMNWICARSSSRRASA